MNDVGTVAPVHKRVLVPCSVERAFTAFTEEIAAWWPLETHSVGEDDAIAVTMEGRVGGHIRERLRDGRSEVWGTIVVWEPPHRVTFTWHPGWTEDVTTDVEVRFTPEGDQTAVELIHTGWERLANGAPKRAGYETGWVPVLARFEGFLGA